MVTFKHREGILCNLVWGLESKRAEKSGEAPAVNFPTEKPRKGGFRRCTPHLSLAA